MNEVELKGLSKEILSVKSINSAENQANELFEMNVEHFGIVYACIKDITFGGRSNLQDESRIQVHSSCNNYIVSQLNTSKKAILIGVGKYNDNVIICAFKPEYSNGNSTISKQIKKETIWNAIKYGFSQQLKGSVYACVFQPAFLSFYIKNHTWIHDAPVEELNKHNEVHDILSLAIPFPRNRIIFGAPGTGKSHKLKEDSEQFENQEPIESDEKDIIKQEIIEANELNDKLNRYIAIGFSHSEFLKDYTTKQIRETFEIENCEDNIYVGAKAKFYYDKYIEDNDDDETITKRINEAKAIKGDGMLQVLAGIGFRFSETLMDYTKEELKKEYPLDSRPQIYWVYRAIHGAKYIKTKKQEKIKYLERVTFHPNYSYAQFVGTYKPVQDTADETQIKYEYVPGPFMRIYTAAKKNTSQNFLLLIEEINRANVAAVFGDVFQLLDRDENGNSEYPVAASEDIKKYLAKNGIHEDELKIPSNMYIWATMNSADQGVFPMDTAFKRRWEFEYIDINKNADKLVDEDNKPILIPIPSKEGKIAYKEIKYDLYKWNDVREKINEKLSEISSVSEDKLLGPFFINLEKLRSAKDELQEFIELFKSKVLMYLFEDVVKISPTKLFEKCGDHPRYSTICSKFDEIGCGIFGFELEKQISSETEPSETANE